MEVRGSSVVAAKRAAKRSALLLEEFSHPRPLRNFTRALGSAGDPPFQLFNADLMSGSRCLDAYGKRGYGTGLQIIHPGMTPEFTYGQCRCFVERFRRHLDGVSNTGRIDE
jgi:hypothetical protein